jgi:hypothetical protein
MNNFEQLSHIVVVFDGMAKKDQGEMESKHATNSTKSPEMQMLREGWCLPWRSSIERRRVGLLAR